MIDYYRNNTGCKKGKDAATSTVERYMNSCLGPDYDRMVEQMRKTLSDRQSNQNYEHSL